MKRFFAAILLAVAVAPAASADVWTRLEVLRGRARALAVTTPESEPLVTETRRVKQGLCTRDVTETRRGDVVLTRVWGDPNCRRISVRP